MAFVRAAIQVDSVDRDIEAIQIKIASRVSSWLATLLSLLVSHRIRRPIEGIRKECDILRDISATVAGVKG